MKPQITGILPLAPVALLLAAIAHAAPIFEDNFDGVPLGETTGFNGNGGTWWGPGTYSDSVNPTPPTLVTEIVADAGSGTMVNMTSTFPADRTSWAGTQLATTFDASAMAELTPAEVNFSIYAAGSVDSNFRVEFRVEGYQSDGTTWGSSNVVTNWNIPVTTAGGTATFNLGDFLNAMSATDTFGEFFYFESDGTTPRQQMSIYIQMDPAQWGDDTTCTLSLDNVSVTPAGPPPPPPVENSLFVIDYDTVGQSWGGSYYDFAGGGEPWFGIDTSLVVRTAEVLVDQGIDNSGCRRDNLDTSGWAPPNEPPVGTDYTYYGFASTVAYMPGSAILPSGDITEYRVNFDTKVAGFADQTNGKLIIDFEAPDDTLSPPDEDTNRDVILRMRLENANGWQYPVDFEKRIIDIGDGMVDGGSIENFENYYDQVIAFSLAFETSNEPADSGFDADNYVFLDNIELVQLLPPVSAGPMITGITAAAPDQLSLTFTSVAGNDYGIMQATGLDGVFNQVDTVSAVDVTTTWPRTQALVAAEFFRVMDLGPAAPAVYLSDDFESGDNGWTTVDNDGAASATVWELGTPDHTNYVAIVGAKSPTNAWGTDLNDGYEANTDIALRSPALDLTAAIAPQVSWAQAVDIDDFDEVNVDSGFVNVRRVSDDSLLEQIATVVDSNLTSGAWGTRTATLPAAVIGSNGEYYLEFAFQSFDSVGRSGWFIDDVTVSEP